MTKFCVLYLVQGREVRSPWFRSHDRACRALAILQRHYGPAILLRD